MKKLFFLCLITTKAFAIQTIDLTQVNQESIVESNHAQLLLKALPPTNSYYIDPKIQNLALKNFKSLALKLEDQKYLTISCNKGSIVATGHMHRVPNYEYFSGPATCQVEIHTEVNTSKSINFSEMSENAFAANQGQLTPIFIPGPVCTGRVCE